MNEERIIDEIRTKSIKLEGADDLNAIVEAIGDAELVLLGEASHGTSEFYTIRAELTKRLLLDKGFSFVAVEGDWPSCYTLNQYIKHKPEGADDAREALRDFNRWPTWMWANNEVKSLAQWLHQHNQSKAVTDRVGFYGLDVYSLWESIDEILTHLKKTDSTELEAAKKAFECFKTYQRDPQTYGVAAAFLSESCEQEVVKLLLTLQEKKKRSHQGDESALNDEINALVAVNAERYYHSMVQGGPESWNIRDRHMVEALNRIKQFHGPRTKAIVWEHNTHVGDARATDMESDGMVNVGQLVREKYGHENVYIVGFGSHRGTVIAANQWGGAIQAMKVPEGMSGSWEDLMHRAGAYDKIMIFDDKIEHLHEMVGHRAIGVVYHPRYERGNYVPSTMTKRYDAFIHVDQSHALDPLKQEVLHI